MAGGVSPPVRAACAGAPTQPMQERRSRVLHREPPCGQVQGRAASSNAYDQQAPPFPEYHLQGGSPSGSRHTQGAAALASQPASLKDSLLQGQPFLFKQQARGAPHYHHNCRTLRRGGGARPTEDTARRAQRK